MPSSLRAAVVNVAGPKFPGSGAIKAWSDRENFDVKVTLEVAVVQFEI